MFGFFKERNLKNYLTETKYLKFKGFEFIIKKLNVMNFIEGSKVLLQTYETYTNARSQKIKGDVPISQDVWDHYTDVICSAVVVPKITRKPTDDPKDIHIEYLFNDMDLVNSLYEEIIRFTSGKKKHKGNWFQGRESKI